MKRSVISILFISLLISAEGKDSRPKISFACELKGKEFSRLLSDSALVKELKEMKVSLRIGLPDFLPERTLTIQKLNSAGIPIYAWLLLPEEEGYWFNMRNGDKAIRKYEEFKKWTSDNQLKWEGIGIDLEPDINDAKLAFKHPWKLAWKAYIRLYDNKSLETGRKVYRDLISKIKSDGYPLESYIIPFIYDERMKKTTSFQKLLGILDLDTEKEIPMMYTSVVNNPGIIPFYHKEGMPVGLGSTGGGVNIEGFEAPAISWENLQRDLLIASGLTDEIFIFCLETSVSRGFLSRIRDLDFSQEAPDITKEIRLQSKTDRKVTYVLVALDHPLLIAIVVFAFASAIIFGLYKLVKFLLSWPKHWRS